MFNIHALREQWDLMTIALKLPRIIALLVKENGRQPTESELSAKTGLSRGVIRRCRLLIELPDRHKDMLLQELKKPKSKQLVSEDLFIEIEKSLKTVSRAMPNVFKDKDRARDVLLKKYKDKVITNVVDFRKVARIARASSVGANVPKARDALQRLFRDPKYSISQAWSETVSDAYAERDIVSRIDHLLEKLNEVSVGAIDDDVREKLEHLIDRVRAILQATA